ncbi:MAG: hypothetical protein R2827_02905 [Bdellovibrionales bacterium]
MGFKTETFRTYVAIESLQTRSLVGLEDYYIHPQINDLSTVGVYLQHEFAGFSGRRGTMQWGMFDVTESSAIDPPERELAVGNGYDRLLYGDTMYWSASLPFAF